MARLLLVTGLPGTGKSTLAAKLAERLGVTLLAKDAVKEQLLEWLPAGDAARSRQLSNASFAVLFMIAQNLLRTGRDVLLEGNFRTGEHEERLRQVGAVRVAQVLCRLDEATRLQRLQARRACGNRHPGHGELAAPREPSNDAFLDLAGERWLLSGAIAEENALWPAIEQWWHSADDTLALSKH